jgi:hypothetical protein
MALPASLPAASAAERPKRPTTAAEVWVRTELYFGTNKPNNEQVTEAELNNFVEQVVTERFPDGLTLLTGYGQFRNSRGELIREKSHLLILFYPPQMQNANKLIQEIREEYKLAFSQESVLRVDGFSFVSF